MNDKGGTKKVGDGQEIGAEERNDYVLRMRMWMCRSSNTSVGQRFEKKKTMEAISEC